VFTVEHCSPLRWLAVVFVFFFLSFSWNRKHAYRFYAFTDWWLHVDRWNAVMAYAPATTAVPTHDNVLLSLRTTWPTAALSTCFGHADGLEQTEFHRINYETTRLLDVKTCAYDAYMSFWRSARKFPSCCVRTYIIRVRTLSVGRPPHPQKAVRPVVLV